MAETANKSVPAVYMGICGRVLAKNNEKKTTTAATTQATGTDSQATFTSICSDKARTDEEESLLFAEAGIG